MKPLFKAVSLILYSAISFHLSAQTSVINSDEQSHGRIQLFLDVHRLGAGNVKMEEVARAHAKDLAVQGKYGVQFLKYWVDESKGLVFCLASAPDSDLVRQTHAEANGLLPERIYHVTAGTEAALKGNRNLFLDVHYLGAGKVSAKDVAAAHEKDLMVQKKYGVNLINYWVDEKEGVVMCLAETKNLASLVKTHKEAHGLLPATVYKVKQGQ